MLDNSNEDLHLIKVSHTRNAIHVNSSFQNVEQAGAKFPIPELYIWSQMQYQS